MAFYIAAADGSFSTAGTWNKVSNTPTIHASTNITPTTGGVFSATFTAPNITGNKSTGALVYCATLAAGLGNWVATLQEDTTGGGAWADTTATATILNANRIATDWMYFSWGTPYAYVYSGANRYRIKLTVSITTSGTAAADTAGTAFAYLETSDITGTPGTSDRTWIVAPNQTGTRTVTVTGTAGSFGDGATSNGVLPAQRSITEACHINSGGILAWDTTANSTIRCKGNIVVNSGGEFRMGSVATPIPTAYKATLELDNNSTSGLSGIRVLSGGRFIVQGAPKPDTANWKTTYTSGSGTAASPLVTAGSVGWSVGDHITVTAAVYNQIEYKYIKTVVASNQYTLADTVGGAESGLANVHVTADRILNLERNAVIAGVNVVSNGGVSFYNGSTTSGDVNIDWARFEWFGSDQGSKSGIMLYSVAGVYAQCDYSVVWMPTYRTWHFLTSKAAGTHTGLIAAGVTSLQAITSGAGFYFSGTASKTLNDCFAIGLQRVGFYFLTSANLTVNSCVVIGCNQVGAATSGSMVIQTLSSTTFNDLGIHASRIQAIYGVAAGIDLTFNRALFGTKGTNTLDIQLLTDIYYTMLFSDSSFGSATLMSNYSLTIPGTLIRFHRFNNTDNNHTWYTANGIGRSTGAGLVDTTVRTNGSLGLRLAPETSDGIRHRYKVLARANSGVNVLGFLRMNSAFAGGPNTALTVSLYLPGSSVADATVTMTKVADTWAVYNLAGNYTSSVSAYATVEVLATNPDAVAGAYVYEDDIRNGTNEITAMDVWDEGQPSQIMFEQLGDAAAVWGIATSTLTTAGTVGNLLRKLLSTAKFLGLK